MTEPIHPRDLAPDAGEVYRVLKVVDAFMPGRQVTVKLEPDDRGITVTARLTLDDDMGTLTVPVSVDDPDDIYTLYRMLYAAQQAQLQANLASAMPPPLPDFEAIRDVDVPEFQTLPLCLEHVGRKKVLDIRADGNTRTLPSYGETAPERDFTEWGFLPGVVVHRSECVKVRGHVEEVRQYHYNSTARQSRTARQKSTLDGRFSRWSELLPQVSKGALHITMCLTCKPLGRWSKTVNAQLSYSVADQPPEEFPWNFRQYNSGAPLGAGARRSLWRRLNVMTPQRWHALAEAIEHTATELDRAENPGREPEDQEP